MEVPAWVIYRVGATVVIGVVGNSVGEGVSLFARPRGNPRIELRCGLERHVLGT